MRAAVDRLCLLKGRAGRFRLAEPFLRDEVAGFLPRHRESEARRIIRTERLAPAVSRDEGCTACGFGTPN
jgi:hypothetical protein